MSLAYDLTSCSNTSCYYLSVTHNLCTGADTFYGKKYSIIIQVDTLKLTFTYMNGFQAENVFVLYLVNIQRNMVPD